MHILASGPELEVCHFRQQLKKKRVWALRRKEIPQFNFEQGTPVNWNAFQGTTSWCWLRECQECAKLLWRQRVATLKNLKYKLYLDLFNTFFGYYVIPYAFFHSLISSRCSWDRNAKQLVDNWLYSHYDWNTLQARHSIYSLPRPIC